jgi:chromosomal replication initiator protein
MQNVWNESLSQIESSISKQSFDTWIRPTRIVAWSDSEVTLAVPNRFFRDWVADNYSDLIAHSLTATVGRQTEVKVIVQPSLEGAGPAVADPDEDEPRATKSDPAYVPPPFLNPKYTFSSFVVGSSNQFANAACVAVADMPAKAYNPLFVYGGVGLGKTHLLHAIGHNVLSRNRGARVCYISSERFINDLISSIQHDRMAEFRNRYRSMDVLLVDDIQFIAGKDRTQEEFFHTFNTLYENNSQIVVSSDSFPKDIRGLEERLCSRFEWGLIADIQIPDLETKVAILNRKASEQNIPISREVAHLIADRVKSNIRELEGCLLRISAYSSITGQPIDQAMAEEVLERIFTRKEHRITIEAIQRAVAKNFNIRVSDLKSKKRIRSISLPRQIAMFISRNHTRASLPEIGRHFGGKDHTTVIHSYNKIDNLIKTDRELEYQINNIIKGLDD